MPGRIPGSGKTMRRPKGRSPSRPTTNPLRARATRYSSFRTHLKDPAGRFLTGGSGFAWVGVEGVIENMNNVSATFYNRTRREADRLADRMEKYARTNARWEDRTGDARRGLKAVVIDSVNREGFTIAFGHSVYYGFFLENKNSGRYAIVEETINWAQQQMLGKLTTSSFKIS